MQLFEGSWEMSEWAEVPLGELVDIFDNRRVPLSSTERMMRQGPFPYYGAQGVIDHIDDYIFDGRYILVPEDGENLRSRKSPIAYFAEGRFWVNNHAHIIKAKPHVAVDRFVQSALQATNIDRWVTGAAQPKLSQRNLKQIPIRIPSREVQQTIAAILDTFDDLIENNRRRVELLEEMARAIYREWFVKFRYPGHEDVPLVDSALGPLPEGWGVSTLFEMAEITMGHSPNSDFYNTDGIGKPFHQGVSDFGPHFPSTRRWCSIDGRSAKPRDILLSVRAPVGRINLADTDITIGRGISAIRAKDGRQALLLGHLREAFVDEDSMGNDGAIFKSLGKAELAALPIVVAPEKIADAANAALTDNLDILRVLTQTNRRLVTIRELLLPKLVTGQIDVSTINLDTLASTVSVDDEEVA